jgi:hypothetical protein
MLSFDILCVDYSGPLAVIDAWYLVNASLCFLLLHSFPLLTLRVELPSVQCISQGKLNWPGNIWLKSHFRVSSLRSRKCHWYVASINWVNISYFAGNEVLHGVQICSPTDSWLMLIIYKLGVLQGYQRLRWGCKINAFLRELLFLSSDVGVFRVGLIPMLV